MLLIATLEQPAAGFLSLSKRNRPAQVTNSDLNQSLKFQGPP